MELCVALSHPATVAPRVLLVLLASILASLVAAGLRSLWHWKGRDRLAATVASMSRSMTTGFVGSAWLDGLKQDAVHGIAAVLVAILAGSIYLIGDKPPLEAAGAVLAIAVAGVAVGQWLTFGITGRSLTPAEVFRDMLATGLLAASASSLGILQVPGRWSEMLLLSQLAAAATAFVYHAANAYRLSTTGKHLSLIAGAMIVGTPYLLGGLTILESRELVASIGNTLTAGVAGAWPELSTGLGRVLVVLALNVVIVQSLHMAMRRSLLASGRGHLAVMAISVAVVAAPWIAAAGSGSTVASLTGVWRLGAVLLATMLSQAALWGEVYLLTGLILDALRGKSPTGSRTLDHLMEGMKKGAIYSGLFLGILYGINVVVGLPPVAALLAHAPLAAGSLLGAMAFPLVKTIVESFDGSKGFFRRLRGSYQKPMLYARGVVAGFGLAYAFSADFAHQETLHRVGFGFAVGVIAFAGVSLLRDCIAGMRQCGGPQSWRVYLVQGVLGGLIGAGLGFYLDAGQVSLVADKFHRYLAIGAAGKPYEVYPLLSKWGLVRLGDVTGGPSLLFAEALAGVISWAVPAWLFAINRAAMTAYFRSETGPIRSLVTPDGFKYLAENMIEVLRWGLWMSPIINSFLRPMGQPTWYNQDGAIHTLWAIFNTTTMSPAGFQTWSLQVFVYLLAYDVVRILIWVDHMGLRVATLVNLSFLGMDRLDGRLARFLGPAATARCIPEGVKRFATWAPLLIPFYLPMGADWDKAWTQAEALRSASTGGGLLAQVASLPAPEKILTLIAAMVASTALFSAIRRLHARFSAKRQRTFSIRNSQYEVTVKENGEAYSHVPGRGYDLTRRSYDLLDPAGRALFLVDLDEDAGAPEHAWPILGNYPKDTLEAPMIVRQDDRLRVTSVENGLRATVEISLPDAADAVELWTIRLENLSDEPRRIKLVPYLEWVLNRPGADRGHTQYNRLFAETEYSHGLHAVLAWDKHSKALGLMATDLEPEGFLTSRIDFIGRARSVWNPRALENLGFYDPEDTHAHPTFDPIGSLMVAADLERQGSTEIRVLVGMAKDKKEAVELIGRHLIRRARFVSPCWTRKDRHSIAHGEIPSIASLPYSEFVDGGRTLRVRTPFTPRPYDHTLSNALGHVVSLTNRGLNTTSNGNSQQNRLTPDWPDIVTREVPAEAFYLYDPDQRQWYSPTYHPLNDPEAAYEVDFGVDGTATYRMRKGPLATELTVFVPPEEPTGVYLLRVKNRTAIARRLRLGTYFQMVLAHQPECAGPLRQRVDDSLDVLYFENPRSEFRSGPAFVAMSERWERVETRRGRFFGEGRGVAHPVFVERGEPDVNATEDDRPVAALLTTLDVPAYGEKTVIVVLGQTDNRQQAEAIVRKYRDPETAWTSLRETRDWWNGLANTVQVRSSQPEIDRYLDWLKYQALAERIWARRGFYQASGAYGFRDQLQDSVNLLWVDPRLARRQIMLHAAQQFVEGDTVHWFHVLQDGRTGFAARTHASDNLLWLAWAVVEYVHATGDQTLLDERVAYLEAEEPQEPLPAGKHGAGFVPNRSARIESVYRHAMRAIDLVLDRRLGAHGLPLIGTGDWNDGLDEIGSQGKGESVWLGFFLHYILERMLGLIERHEGATRRKQYERRLEHLKHALQATWRDDRYLRAIHDDGTEIGVRGSGVWEIDALTAAWAVMSGIDKGRGRVVFDTALEVLERENTILLGWPALREDTVPYLGRSSGYPEGVRENGMYCHGVQWLVGAARILADDFAREGQAAESRNYREIALRLWLKISPISHVVPREIETFGGQPNKQPADILTAFDPGRMIWHGYTGAAGWMFRQALEGVMGAKLVGGEVIAPAPGGPRSEMRVMQLTRDVTSSPLSDPATHEALPADGRETPLTGPTRPRWRSPEVPSQP